MPTVWYAVLAAMLTTYAVLDGFDLGAGIVQFLVARTEAERRTVIAAIGPFWDGNEVWLIAAGGVFFFAFPPAYAAAFSGLYLPLMVVLWLVILRGLSIELGGQLDSPLWRRAFDATFAGSSATLAVVLGVALGNVVRGVPLDATGYFHEDLFGGPAGAIDPFTAWTGAFALIALGAHGATFLAWKTEGALGERSSAWARRGYGALLGLVVVATAIVVLRAPAFAPSVADRPWLWPLPLLSLGAAWSVRRYLRDGRRLAAFLASCVFIASMLVATAGALFPTILRSTVDPAYTLDTRCATPDHALTAGLALWAVAACLAVSYFAYLFRQFRGKAKGGAGHG
jgi:cytochrome d ubiquinol oxidase subunit II